MGELLIDKGRSRVIIFILSRSLLKKILIVLLIPLIFIQSIPIQKAEANPLAVAIPIIGVVEIGTLALWGGAVLVASAGTAVGMDPELMNDVSAWGKDMWVGANDVIKASWTASVEGLKTGAKASVEWSQDVLDYFKTGIMSMKYALNASGDTIIDVIQYNGIRLPSYIKSDYHQGENLGRFYYGDWYLLYEVQVTVNGYPRLYVFREVSSSFSYLNMANQVNNAWQGYSAAVAQYGIVQNGATVTGKFVTDIPQPYQDVFWPGDTAIPRKVTLPQPRWTLNPDGTARLANPTVGRVGGTTAGDIAVGYPISGTVADLAPTDAISTEINPPPTKPPTPKPPTSKWNPFSWLKYLLDWFVWLIVILVYFLTESVARLAELNSLTSGLKAVLVSFFTTIPPPLMTLITLAILLAIIAALVKRK